MAAYEEQEYNKPFSLRTWAKMLPFFRPYKKHFAVTMGLNVFLAAVDVGIPLFQSYAIDRFITPGSLEGLKEFALVYALVIVFQTVCVYVSVHAAITIEMNLGRDLKWAQFEHLQTLSFSYYNTTPVGYIHARVMSDTLRIATMVAWSLVDMLWALIYVVSVFVIMCVCVSVVHVCICICVHMCIMCMCLCMWVYMYAMYIYVYMCAMCVLCVYM